MDNKKAENGSTEETGSLLTPTERAEKIIERAIFWRDGLGNLMGFKSYVEKSISDAEEAAIAPWEEQEDRLMRVVDHLGKETWKWDEARTKAKYEGRAEALAELERFMVSDEQCEDEECGHHDSSDCFLMKLRHLKRDAEGKKG